MQPYRNLIAEFADALEQRPRIFFAGFLLLHGTVWTLLPTLLYRNLPPHVIEALTYGREWQLGYDKLPPLPWWGKIDVAATMQVITSIIEGWVREHPEQWIWAHRRWR
jgi:lauroyl/myristoyl acyltransferase